MGDFFSVSFKATIVEGLPLKRHTRVGAPRMKIVGCFWCPFDTNQERSSNLKTSVNVMWTSRNCMWEALSTTILMVNLRICTLGPLELLPRKMRLVLLGKSSATKGGRAGFVPAVCPCAAYLHRMFSDALNMSYSGISQGVLSSPWRAARVVRDRVFSISLCGSSKVGILNEDTTSQLINFGFGEIQAAPVKKMGGLEPGGLGFGVWVGNPGKA